MRAFYLELTVVACLSGSNGTVPNSWRNGAGATPQKIPHTNLPVPRLTLKAVGPPLVAGFSMRGRMGAILVWVKYYGMARYYSDGSRHDLRGSDCARSAGSLFPTARRRT